MSEGEFKLLSELRVTELKTELDKRGLDKNGIKVLLTDRLEKALQAEGHDPVTFKFAINESSTPLTSPLTSPAKGKEESKTESEAVVENATKIDEIPKEEEELTTGEPEAEEAHEEYDEEEQQNEEEQLEDPLNEPPAPEPELKPPTKAPESCQLSDPDRMLWVHNLNPTTKAADLRELFSQHGKVLRAKIFTSKKVPGKTFGLITVNDTDMVTRCFNAHNNKQWNGQTITLEKGNAKNTATKAAAAAPLKDKDASKSGKDAINGDGKKDEKTRGVEKDDKTTTGNEKDREKRDADRGRSRREPIKPPRSDKRRIIPARRPLASSTRSGIRPPAVSSRLSVRTSNSHRSSATRSRTDSYGRSSDADRDRIRAREEELRRKAAEMELERERERLRAERERIEREKLELQVMKQKAQLAAYEKAAHAPSSRSHHSESSRHGTSSSSRHDDRYSSRTGGDAQRSHDRNAVNRDRERSSRGDDRRPVASNGDRSRSRHESHREPAGQRDSRYNETRRGDARGAAGSSSTYNGPRAFATREPSSVAGGQNFYGSRSTTYPAPAREYEHGSRIAPASNTWASSGAGNWPGVSGDSWEAKNSASSWNSYSGANPANVRIDYDKYHRQRQF